MRLTASRLKAKGVPVSTAERSAYDKMLSYLVVLDARQTANLPKIAADITANEVNLCLSIQAFQELSLIHI